MCNDLIALDVSGLETFEWVVPKFVGGRPSARHSHSMLYAQDHLFVYGGYGTVHFISCYSCLSLCFSFSPLSLFLCFLFFFLFSFLFLFCLFASPSLLFLFLFSLCLFSPLFFLFSFLYLGLQMDFPGSRSGQAVGDLYLFEITKHDDVQGVKEQEAEEDDDKHTELEAGARRFGGRSGYSFYQFLLAAMMGGGGGVDAIFHDDYDYEDEGGEEGEEGEEDGDEGEEDEGGEH